MAPRTAVERLLALGFTALILAALVLGVTDALSAIDTLGVVGIVLVLHAVALVRNIRLGPLWILQCVLTVALGALLAASALVPSGGAESGVTGQGTAFDVSVAHGRILSLSTSLTAKCTSGKTWSANWSPANGRQVHVAMTGRAFSTRERSELQYAGGIVARAAFLLSGRFTGPASAQGTVRLVARFYRGGREWSACDSLAVPWAVGPGASFRLRQVAPR